MQLDATQSTHYLSANTLYRLNALDNKDYTFTLSLSDGESCRLIASSNEYGSMSFSPFTFWANDKSVEFVNGKTCEMSFTGMSGVGIIAVLGV